MLLVGNKSDMSDIRRVSLEEGMEFARALGAQHWEVSARTGEGLSELLYCIFGEGEKITEQEPGTLEVGVNLNNSDAKKEKREKKEKKDCC
jgi:hypothetical protein